MDKLYIGDIPNQFSYAVISGDYITLYSQPSARNETLPYYRIYDNGLGFFYSQGTTTFGNTTTSFQPLEVTDNFLYRSDIDSIFICSTVLAVFILFIFNLVTSMFRSHGVLGDLL